MQASILHPAMTKLLRLLVPILALALAHPASAQDTILTITGDVAPPPTGDAWTFDIAALQALPLAKVETTTIWTEGPQTFEGVSLKTLLEQVGAKEGTIKAFAVNDYSIDIPTSDAVEDGPILAYLHNGSEMSLREKGPLWIIYPYDQNDDYKTEEYYSRSIWQLDRMQIVADQ